MLNELLTRYPVLCECKDDIIAAKEALSETYKGGGKLLVCGNGGSCADSDHIVGELMKGFLKKRPLSDAKKAEMKANCGSLVNAELCKLQGALPAIALPSLTALGSAFCNDVEPDLVYAQGVLGLGKKGDVLICISTSGNSKNVVAAAKVAKGIGVKTVALTGKKGGALKNICDVSVCVPETETFKVQELHLPVYHYICAAIEDEFFAE